MQLGIDAARRLELEDAGAGDRRARDAMARQQVAGPAGLLGGLGDRPVPLVPAARMLGRAVIGLRPDKGKVRCLSDTPGEVGATPRAPSRDLAELFPEPVDGSEAKQTGREDGQRGWLGDRIECVEAG